MQVRVNRLNINDMDNCPDCFRLRQQTSAAYSEYVLRKDELAITSNRDKSFSAKQRTFLHSEDLLKEARRREDAHREGTHRGYGQDNESLSPVQRLEELREFIGLNDRGGVEQAIFAMGATHNGWISVPDAIVEGILTTLRDPSLHGSGLAAHLLNYFEFESSSMSSSQKNLVKGFLQEHGDRFTDVHSAQVVTELRHDSYLN